MTTTTLDHPEMTGPDVRSAQIVLEPLEESGGGTVSLGEIARMALDSMVSNKLRSLLTTLGVIIGVASVVALMAIGNGATASITGQVQSIGTNLLTVMSGMGGGGNRPGQAVPVQNLTLSDARAIEALGLPLAGVAPEFSGSAQVVATAADQNASILGTTPAYAALNSLTLQSGSFVQAQDEQSLVIVLGANLATDLFGNGQAVDQFVYVNNESLHVIGVLAAKGGGAFGSVDDRAFVPIAVAQQRLFGARTADGNDYRVSSIAVAAQNAGDLDAIQGQIGMLLRDRHHLAADGSEDDFMILNQASLLGTLSTITGTLTAFLAAIAGISLLVGGIGIMNIMLVSVTERTREIGLRKAVGARARDILVQFIAEALTISLAGGLIGLALGAGLAGLVSLTGLMSPVVSANSVALAVGFALAVGLFFGIYPARRASQLNPIDALRSE